MSYRILAIPAFAFAVTGAFAQAPPKPQQQPPPSAAMEPARGEGEPAAEPHAPDRTAAERAAAIMGAAPAATPLPAARPARRGLTSTPVERDEYWNGGPN